MATLGRTTTPTFGNWGEGFNVGDQVAYQVTMPSPGGNLTALHAYAASFNGTNTMTLVVWDNSGNVLASVASGAGVGTSPAWVSGTLASPLYVTSGTVLWLGWVNPNNTAGNSGFIATYDAVGGNVRWNFQASVPGNLFTGSNATSYGSRALGAYADYTPGTLKIRRSGVWTPTVLKIRRSGVWVTPPVSIRRSGVWVRVQ